MHWVAHKHTAVEIICWESMKAAQADLEKLPQISEFQKYCSTLIDEGTMMFHLEEAAAGDHDRAW